MSNEVRTQPDLKGFLLKHVDKIQSVAAATIQPEKLVRLICAAATRQPDLAACTPMSILNALMQAATFGIVPFDGSNEGYIVSYNVKKRDGNGWEKQAQFIPGYQGLVRKAIDSKKVRNIESRVVYEHDVFDYELGLKPSIVHKPKLGRDRGEVIAFYAVAFLPDGSTQFEVMAIDEVEAIKGRSKSGNNGPWVTDFNEMGRKTVVRRLYKYIPKSKEMAGLLELQAKAEAGEFLEGEVIRPGDAPVQAEPMKVVNEDGAAVYEWTDEHRAQAKLTLDDYAEAMAQANVPEDEINRLRDEHRLRIGDLETSPDKWADHYYNATDRAIKAAKIPA